MSAERAFKDNCGPHVEFVSTQLFDQGRRREFVFVAFGKEHAIGTRGESLNDGKVAGERAALWAEGHARAKVV